MTGLPFRKLYVDTRFKTTDSISNTDFKYQLRVPASMPANATFCIDEINIPYAWNTVEAGINDKLYFSWQMTLGSNAVYTIITLPPKRYDGADLAAQIQTQLNASGNGTWTISYDFVSNTITFTATNGNRFRILTDEDLVVYASNFPTLNRSNPQSINEIIQISRLTGFNYNSPTNPFKSGFLNLLNYQDIYITSGNMGSFDSQGARGESSVIRKICVNAAWGFSIIDKLSWDSDQMSCSKLALSTLDFQLRDVNGRIIDLHGGHMSFTLLFQAN